MKEKHLTISLPGHVVGELRQSKQGLSSWTPEAAWLARDQMPRLGLDLRDAGPRASANDLPAWFQNILPERGSTLRARLAEAHGLREGQSFELLRALGSDFIGAVATSGGEETPSEVEKTGASEADRMSGLTGMQLKFSMSMAGDRLVLTARAGRRLWIVKIAGADFPELAEVEATTMSWARRAGFDVPEHRIVPFDRLDGIPPGWVESPAAVFAIRRFDRRDDGSRIHQEDLCQALAQRPANKYGDDGPLIGFEGALRVVVDACGEEDGREMARRLGFVIASGNGDAHLKNWTLVWGDATRPSLSPCYDFVSTVAWSALGWARWGGPRMALRLGGATHFRQLDDHVLGEASARSFVWLAQEVDAGVIAARDTRKDAAESAPERMRRALDEQWAATPLLARRVGAAR